MVIFHCDKLCSGECCEILAAQLQCQLGAKVPFLSASANVWARLDRGHQPTWGAFRTASDDLADPDKLAELMAKALRARGFTVVVVSPEMQHWKAPNHLSIRWHHDDDFGVYDDGLMPFLFAESYTPTEFRTLLIRIMATPANTRSREQCERIVRDRP